MRYFPDGLRLTRNGVVFESSSKRVSGSGTPTRPAIATRWMIALVEPPMAMSARMALSKACAVRICEGLGPPAIAISTARRPAISAIASRRESDAGDRRIAGQGHPERLDHRGHRRGGAHHHAVPARARHARFGLTEPFVGATSRAPLGPESPRVRPRAGLLRPPP